MRGLAGGPGRQARRRPAACLPGWRLAASVEDLRGL